MSNTYLGSPRLGHLVGGHPEFNGWPRWDSFTHQSVYEDWLGRAWQGGLRLMVMHAVNSEFLCNLVRKAFGRTCNDMEAVDYQIQVAKEMEAYIDKKWGGAGKGWYRIVKTPDEAQAVIDAGKLAVVLGIEVDFLFGSYLKSGFPYKDGGLTENQVHSQLDKYYQMGVRHVFPIHFADNEFGGASYDKLLQYDHFSAGDSLYLPIPLAKIPKPYAMATQDASGQPYNYRYNGGRMNIKGLTNLGKFLIEELMTKGMIIDVDHTSFKSRSAILDIAESKNCPVVSGHTGFVEISNGDEKYEDKRYEGNLLPREVERIRALGGMVAIIPYQGKLNQINTYDSGAGGTLVEHTCGNSSETVVQAYLYAASKMKGGPVGFGTDMNGGIGLPGPRFGPEACPGGGRSQHGKGVSYPFVADASGATLYRSMVGQKTFDFNNDGLAHVGMLPDLIADFKALGLTDADLSPLLNSAQGYIDAWRKVRTNGPMPSWTSLGGILTSDPAVFTTKDGTLDVFVRGNDNGLYHVRQSANSFVWGNWQPLGGFLTSDPVVGQYSNGRLFVLVVGSDNRLYTISESTPGTNQWTSWVLLGGTQTVTSKPVIGRNQNNRLVVFARGTDGGLLSLLQTTAGGTLSKWGLPPPGGGKLVGKPAFALTHDYRMAVFVRGTDNKLYYTEQGEVNVNDDWSNWFPIDLTGTLVGDPAVGKNMDDTLEVFVRGTDNGLYHVRQSANSFVWGNWQPLGVLTSDPVVGQYSDGRLDVFGRGTDGKLYHLWQTTPGNRQWTSWVPLGGSLTGKPSIASTRPMKLDVFVRGAADDLRYATIVPAAP